MIKGNRTYIQHIHGKTTLVTWSQKRCVRCKRFLSMKQLKYCKRCAVVMHKKRDLDYAHKHKDLKKVRDFIYNHIETLEVGQYV